MARLDRSQIGSQGEVLPKLEAHMIPGRKTVLTLDGAQPDVETAKRHGLRYVHVPIGYDGIPAARALELAKTFQTLEPSGPIFVHCHHGKHRGPAACSIALRSRSGSSSS